MAGASGARGSVITNVATLDRTSEVSDVVPAPSAKETQDAPVATPGGTGRTEPRPPPQRPGCDGVAHAPCGMRGPRVLLGPLKVAGLMVMVGEAAVGAVATTTAL